MKKILFFLYCFFISTIAIAHEAPQRIISLKPNITEIVYALGAGDKLVGVTTYCNRPAAATKLPQVADYISPSLEKVAALQPDLLLTSKENSASAPILRLQELGYRVAFFDFNNLQHTLTSIEEMGQVLGETEAGKNLANSLREQLGQIKKKRQTLAKTLFVVGTGPLIAVGPNTLLSELLEIAGGSNVLKNGNVSYPRLNEESLLQLQPDVILTLYMSKENGAEPWQKFPQIPAMQNHAIYHLDADDFRAGPNLANAAKKLQQLLHEHAD